MYIAHCSFRLQVLKLVIRMQAIPCPEELWYVSVRTQLVFCSTYFLAHISAFAGVSQWRLYSTLRTCLQAGCDSAHHSNILCCKCWQNITFPQRLILKAYSLHHKTPAKADVQATNCLLQKTSYVVTLTYHNSSGHGMAWIHITVSELVNGSCSVQYTWNLLTCLPSLF